jgi:hypothetical protein
MAITRAQQARQMLKKGSKEPVEQAGVMNYMPSEMVTVPKIAKSSPEHPTAKLAYITDAEKKLLIKKNLHGSLKGKPNRGPGGIPSLQGDFGSPTGQVSTAAGSFDEPGGTYSGGGADFGGAGGDFADDSGVSVQDQRKAAAEAKRKAAQTIIKPDFEGPDFGPRFGIPQTTAQKKALQNYLNQVDLAMYGKDPLVIGDEDDADSIDDLLTSGTDAAKLLEDDKKSELVESLINQPVTGADTGILSVDMATGALAEMFGKNQAKLRSNLVDLSERQAKERIINYPGFMTKDGQPMSFDANAKIQSNYLSNLLDQKKKEYLNDPDKNFTYDGPDKKTGRIDLYDLKPGDQKEINKKFNEARMKGQIDASGNFKAGVYITKDGLIIDNRDDRGGGRSPDPATITSNPELLKLQKENKDLQNQLAQQDQNIFYRLAADGGMIEDAPVGGIMDLESGRQMYFLGKLVKKATRAVKKIVKSPLGKAALIGGLGYLGFKGMGGASGLSKFLFKEGGKGLSFGELLKGGLTGKGMLALGGALTAAPLLFGRQEEDDTIDPALLGPRINIAELLANPYQATLGTGFVRSAADGGRIGYKDGTIESGAMMSEKEMKKLAKSPLYKGFKKMYGVDPSSAKDNPAYDEKFSVFETLFKKGYQKGGDVEPVAKKTMPLLDMDGQEMDLRDNGGFVPIGRMEKADDVPARLSKNEFVFTADAVRNAGDGDVDKGAEVMYNMMKNLERGGNVSDESQGLEGAREMFQTSKRLEEVL